MRVYAASQVCGILSQLCARAVLGLSRENTKYVTHQDQTPFTWRIMAAGIYKHGGSSVCKASSYGNIKLGRRERCRSAGNSKLDRELGADVSGRLSYKRQPRELKGGWNAWGLIPWGVNVRRPSKRLSAIGMQKEYEVGRGKGQGTRIGHRM